MEFNLSPFYHLHSVSTSLFVCFFLPFWQLLISMQRHNDDLRRLVHYSWYILFYNNVCCFIFVKDNLSLYGNALETESLPLTCVFIGWSANWVMRWLQYSFAFMNYVMLWCIKTRWSCDEDDSCAHSAAFLYVLLNNNTHCHLLNTPARLIVGLAVLVSCCEVDTKALQWPVFQSKLCAEGQCSFTRYSSQPMS